MSSIPLNIISPKALDKQLKVVESRIQVLQAEITELEKVKNACLVLLGSPDPSQVESAEAAWSSPPGKPGKKKRSESAPEEDADPISVAALSAEPPVEEAPTAY
jgi:hypothetical protein